MVPCFTVVVCAQHFFQRFEITARATEELTIGKAPNVTTIPADDLVAAYQIEVPRFYRFNRHFRWNPACCKDTPRGRTDESSPLYPEDELHDWIVDEKGEVVQKPWEWEDLEKWHVDPKHYEIPVEPDPPKEED